MGRTKSAMAGGLGVGVTALGVGVFLLGALLFFNSWLLSVGNLLFVACVSSLPLLSRASPSRRKKRKKPLTRSAFPFASPLPQGRRPHLRARGDRQALPAQGLEKGHRRFLRRSFLNQERLLLHRVPPSVLRHFPH